MVAFALILMPPGDRTMLMLNKFPVRKFGGNIFPGDRTMLMLNFI